MKQPNLVTVAANTHQAALFWHGDLWKGRTSHMKNTPLSHSCEIDGVDVVVLDTSVRAGFLWKKAEALEGLTRDEQFDVLSKRAVVEQATIQREALAMTAARALSKRAVVEQATIQREGGNRQNHLAGWLPGSPAYKARPLPGEGLPGITLTRPWQPDQD